LPRRGRTVTRRAGFIASFIRLGLRRLTGVGIARALSLGVVLRGLLSIVLLPGLILRLVRILLAALDLGAVLTVARVRLGLRAGRVRTGWVGVLQPRPLLVLVARLTIALVSGRILRASARWLRAFAGCAFLRIRVTRAARGSVALVTLLVLAQ